MGILFLFLHITFYATFVDVTSYVYCSEIFPTNQRAQGVAVSIFGLFMTTLSKLHTYLSLKIIRELTTSSLY
jgi:hypothetical protein